MNHLDFDPHADTFGFAASANATEGFSGPYIPEARDCMSCGACVPGCPTYRVRQNENFGPRGRVRLFERVLRRQEDLSDEEWGALDACTLCRACETVCPSQMNYAALHRQVLEARPMRPRDPVAIRLLLGVLVKSRAAQRALGRLVAAYQASGVQRLLGTRLPASISATSLGRLEKLLPVTRLAGPVPRTSLATPPARRGRIALFTGCVANTFDTATHHAIVKLLTHMGYDVSPLANQACCGAIHAHNGRIDEARANARRTVGAIAASDADLVIHSASGCGAFIGEYASLLDADSAGGSPDVAPRAVDVLDFLAEHDALDRLTFRPLSAKVAVHEPCSQRNVLRNQAAVYRLLGRIPGLDVITLPGTDVCCGAGGTKMLTRPDIARPLRADKVDAVEATQADLLVSSNLSCALHLSSGLRERGLAVEVLHPVRLLANQLS